MLTFFRRRQLKRNAKEALRHAANVENMRGDLLTDAQLRELHAGCAALAELISPLSDMDATRDAMEHLYVTISRLAPRKRFAALCENVEILVVAVAVAMGFRTYFLQPFKIPTGSMEPTLYGIHSDDNSRPGFMDRFPLKYAKWIVTGQMRHDIRARNSGTLSGPQAAGPNHPASIYVYIGAERYKLPRNSRPRFMPGDFVEKGSMLWSGTITAGDHVFVNKLAWNVRRPRRGEIMVFSTDGILGIQPHTHYIKRLIGLPGESMSIDPPWALADGQRIMEPEGIRRIAECQPGYHGYQLPPDADYLGRRSDTFVLGPDRFFAMGDNTLNSKDGRYWGAVPQENMVGPATFIYWPVGRRWGLTD